MPLPKQHQDYTTEYIYSLPDGQRAELIDGQVYMMAPPSRKHQRITVELSTVINNFIKSRNGSCEVDIAPFAVFLNQDQNKLTEKGCNGAPDWIIEIVSPSSRRMDYYIKLFKYRTAGVREYWIVDSDKNRITVYNFESEDTIEYSFSDIVASGIYPELSIDFNEWSF